MKFSMTPMIRPPAPVTAPPKQAKAVSMDWLLAAVGLSNRVTGGLHEILVHPGSEHFLVNGKPCVGLSRRLSMDFVQSEAGFVLEVLAHGFHDYTARENICGRLRYHPDRRGRERTGKAMSSAERVRKFRLASKRN
ncbi:MAG: hypothetical protein BroJett021_34230 [Chloroflexota bacterium]|nr:MAG: hypothetical protein BroJett021_34230 [Chloroflexota bacterium]